MLILTTYPENSSSEEGSLSSSTASEPCFLELFSGCLCAVEVRAGWCRPLPIQLLSNKELDLEPGADTTPTSYRNWSIFQQKRFITHSSKIEIYIYKYIIISWKQIIFGTFQLYSTCLKVRSSPPAFSYRGFLDGSILLWPRRELDAQRALVHPDGRPWEGSTGTLRLHKGNTKKGGMAVMENSNKD